MAKIIFYKNRIIKSTEILISFCSLIIGGLIYVLYRSENLLMFKWLNGLGLYDEVVYIRMHRGCSLENHWIVYNMPAGLWLLSYMLIIDVIWYNNKCFLFNLFLLSLPIIAVLSEFLQLFDIFPGTFDVKDIVFYIISILLFNLIKLLKNEN